MAKQKKTPAKFEDAIEQLEQIIEQIESGEVGLEQCLGFYERGIELEKHCQKILDTAQKRIAELTKDSAGELQISAGEEDPDSDEDAPAEGTDDH